MSTSRETAATTLCKSCGLCCSGHLFTWVKLRASELDSAKALNLPVLGSKPSQRGFNQPCPLWNGQCTVYNSPSYPHFCRLYKCQLLKKVMDERTTLPEALTVIHRAKEIIQEVESLLPVSSHRNFRERLVAHLESGSATAGFQNKAGILLRFYNDVFGVKDLLGDME